MHRQFQSMPLRISLANPHMNWLAIPPAFWTALAYTGGVLAFIAGMLVVRAVRGRPVGWQPVCRRCKHDLRGVDPGKGTCPECGADLTRSGAVRTGGRVRRAGAIVVALIAVAVAGTTLWWLTPSRISRVRTDLVASMPLEALIDTMLSGLADETSMQLARSAVDLRLGTRGGFPQQGGTRTVPSGELLDAILKAFSRAGEAGRTPVGALIERDARTLLTNLDEPERERLLELALEEILASNATKIDLARGFVLSAGFRREPDGAVNTLVDRLGQTEAGRAALQPRLVVKGQGTVGGVIKIELEGPLDALRQFRQSGFDRRKDALLIERVEAVAANAPAGAAPTMLRSGAAFGADAFGNDMEIPGLLADLPAGAHQIRVVGVVAPQAVVPKRRTFAGATSAAITAEEAAKLEGARAIDQTFSVMVMPRQGPPAPIQRTLDPKAVEFGSNLLKNCTLTTDSFGARVDFDSLAMNIESGPDQFALGFTMTCRQNGRSVPLGSINLNSGGGGGMSGGSSDRSFRPQDPFEIVFDPSMPAAVSWSGGKSDPIPVVWARYTLRFANANAKPEVTSEVLPDTPAVATPLPREQAQAMLQQSIAKSHTMNLMQRRSRMPEQDQINFSFWSTAPARAEAGSGSGSGSGDEAQPFILSGDFELRSEGSLLAPITAWVVTLDADGSGVAFEVGKEVVELYPRTLRYTPNEGHARARIPVSFRYIAEPFELRYANASTPPELVWLETTPKKTDASEP